MSRLKAGLFKLLAFCAGLACVPWARSQQAVPPVSSTTSNPVPGTGEGAAEGSVVRDTATAYENVFHDLSNGAHAPVKFGYGGGDAGIGANLGPGFGTPLLQWGARPEDAQLKLGRFYLQLRSLSGSLLYSDNINLTEKNRKDGVIGIVELSLAAIYQVNDALRFVVGGQIDYFPFKGKVGFSVPGGVLFDIGPRALAQVEYNVPLGGWEIRAYDELAVRRDPFSRERSFDILNRPPSSIEDVMGRYNFRLVEAPTTTTTDRDFGRNDLFQNSVGVSSQRLLPTVTMMTIHARHDNFWEDGNSSGFPSSADNFGFSLMSQRETMRFKPFLEYEANRLEGRGWDHQVRAGVRGPVTDYIDFLGDFGYYNQLDGSTDSYLWDLELIHNPRPSTWHRIMYSRSVTYPYRYIVTDLEYRIAQGMGPYVTSDFAVARRTYQIAQAGGSSYTEYRAEAGLSIVMGPRTHIRPLVSYYKITDIKPGPSFDADVWTGRLEFDYQFTDKLRSNLFYQHQRRDSQKAGDSYYESLAGLTITKIF